MPLNKWGPKIIYSKPLIVWKEPVLSIYLNFFLATWKWEKSKSLSKPESLEETYNPKNDPYDSKRLKILSVTWNMHGKPPPKEIERLFRFNDIYHDLYIIGT